MFLEIDHVAIPSVQFDRHIDILKSLGYEIKFIEKNVENLSIKRKLLKTFSKYHNLALLTTENDFGIEVIKNKQISLTESYIIPVFENLPNELINEKTDRKFKDCGFEIKMNMFDIVAYTKQFENNSKFKFNKLIIKTKDMEKSVQFWKIFGLKPIKSEKDFTLLEFKSLLSKRNYYLYVKEDEESNNNYNLDDNGFNCLAFVSNSAKHEKNIFDKEGIYTTDMERLRLNNKLLNIFFVKGPSGEVVEVISVQK